MRCAFPWTTFALVSGKSPQIVYTLDYNDASTAWIDPNPATGTKLQFQFPAKLPPELNGTPFYIFDFASGVDRPVEAFKNYARINKAKLFYNGKALYYVVFADTYRWQHVNFRGHHGKSRGPNQRHQQQYGNYRGGCWVSCRQCNKLVADFFPCILGHVAEPADSIRKAWDANRPNRRRSTSGFQSRAELFNINGLLEGRFR